jgi:adenylyl-sulfate kinase
MLPSRATISAVLIAASQTPLQPDERYAIHWSGGVVSGRISCISQRLHSPLVTTCPGALLGPQELASVEIEVASPHLSPTLDRVHQMALLDPITGHTLANGLLIPNPRRDGSHSRPLVRDHGITVWLTGLSGSGKTTIAREVQQRMSWCTVELFDADIVRTYLCKDLGYSREDRDENVRRLTFVADLLTHRGRVVLITAIAPYRAARDEARKIIGRFVEVYVNAPVEICEQRDVKGLYKKARAGEIRFFTGIDDPYEPPLTPEVECRTDRESIEVSVSKVVEAIEQRLFK